MKLISLIFCANSAADKSEDECGMDKYDAVGRIQYTIREIDESGREIKGGKGRDRG